MILGPREPTQTEGNADFSSCTGVLVAPNIVLTAAHCLKPVEEDVPLFHDGAIKNLGLIGFAAAPGEIRRVVRFVVHEGFRGQEWIQTPQGFLPRTPRDVGLAYFDGETPAAAKIAEIPALTIDRIVKEDFQIFGYGVNSLDPSAQQARDNLVRKGRRAFMEATPLLTIRRKATYTDVFEYGFVIDQRGQPGICYGDSGGPAFIQVNGKTLLVGIHSHRTGPYKGMQGIKPVDPNVVNDCQYFSVMTRTGAYATWIRNQIELLQAGACEHLPVFRRRVAELFSVDPTTMELVKGPEQYNVRGVTRSSKRPVSMDFASDIFCRVPTSQGYLFKDPDDRTHSAPLKELREFLASRSDLANAFQIRLLDSRIPEGLRLDGGLLLNSAAGLEMWRLPDDGWIFQPVRNNRNDLEAVPPGAGAQPNSVFAALGVHDTGLRARLLQMPSRGIELKWAAYARDGLIGFMQELWLSDPKTQEIMILRQSVDH